MPAKTALDYPRLCKSTIYDSLIFCIETAAAQGLETLVLDMTRRDIGLPVVKVIVPGLRHFWRRLAPGRLYDVPVKMKWLKAPLTEEELNPLGLFI
ncbi:MAG: YcaO-like family protein [Acidobacteria bacterium]|jgi:ribosomal protein S12 methylthiotransferase accessory factor|nr:YcaO-like family protein [Acidobacteriota bacterium]